MTNIPDTLTPDQASKLIHYHYQKNPIETFTFVEPEMAKAKLNEGRKYYHTHETVIAITFVASLALATIVTLAYLNKLSFPNTTDLKITFIAVSGAAFVLASLSTWYVCAKLGTLKSQFGWTASLVEHPEHGATFDASSGA